MGEEGTKERREKSGRRTGMKGKRTCHTAIGYQVTKNLRVRWINIFVHNSTSSVKAQGSMKHSSIRSWVGCAVQQCCVWLACSSNTQAHASIPPNRKKL